MKVRAAKERPGETMHHPPPREVESNWKRMFFLSALLHLAVFSLVMFSPATFSGRVPKKEICEVSLVEKPAAEPEKPLEEVKKPPLRAEVELPVPKKAIPPERLPAQPARPEVRREAVEKRPAAHEEPLAEKPKAPVRSTADRPRENPSGRDRGTAEKMGEVREMVEKPLKSEPPAGKEAVREAESGMDPLRASEGPGASFKEDGANGDGSGPVGVSMQFRSSEDLFQLMTRQQVRLFGRVKTVGFDLLFAAYPQKDGVVLFKPASSLPPKLWEISGGRDYAHFISLLSSSYPAVGSFPNRQVLVTFNDPSLEGRVEEALGRLQSQGKNGVLSITSSGEIVFQEIQPGKHGSGQGNDDR